MTTFLSKTERHRWYYLKDDDGCSWKRVCSSIFGSCGCISDSDDDEVQSYHGSENQIKPRPFSSIAVKWGIPVGINSTTMIYGSRADDPKTEISFFSRLRNCCRRKIPTRKRRTSEAEHKEQRTILINDKQSTKFMSNVTTTAKYTFYSFLPTFLYEQFRRYSNLFFLFIALLQQIPGVSPTGRFLTVIPLTIILFISAIKEIVEDIKRDQADKEINKRKVTVLKDQNWIKETWANLCVGDIVKISDEEFFPADLILLASNKSDGICFIQTANLDGETNMKVKQAIPETIELINETTLSAFTGTIECELPNRRIYDFFGVLKRHADEPVPFGPNQFLQRGAALAHTEWIHGIVIYTGHETKLMKNYARAPLKSSSVDVLMNKQISTLFGLFAIIVILSSSTKLIWEYKNYKQHTYLGIMDAFVPKDIVLSAVTFLILISYMIPISLQVTLEMVRLFQAYFISNDIEMYHKETDTTALARTSNLNEELGMVKYVLTDKTGTLTCNIMKLKKCSIAGKIYEVTDRVEESQLVRDLHEGYLTSFVIKQFMLAITLCHSVISEIKDDGTIIYHATNPDDYAIIQGARSYGYEFITRSGDYIDITRFGVRERYQVLQVLEFTSSRKRMSVIVRMPAGNIRLYCKGADSVIFERLSSDVHEYYDVTREHLSGLAAMGFRTLCCAMTDLNEEEYQEWSNVYRLANTALVNREEQMEHVSDQIEQNLTLLGATAIEDKLQDGVLDTIQTILAADIRIWMLTGDKQETAINIGFSSGLLHQSMKLILLNEQNIRGTFAALQTFGAVAKGHKAVAMVIDGKTLQYALSKQLRELFKRISLNCQVLICCRLSPMQKGEITELVNSSGACTLAIGDGGNDVAMIRKAKVGVGISGAEGLQAACASDYSIAQFRYLRRLLFVHGTWNYRRTTTLILYTFYKNICMCLIQLWYSFYNGWSAQILFESWSIAGYNIIFTAMPPLVIGIFDKICNAETLLKYPSIYKRAHDAKLFNVGTFCMWIINAFIHSGIIFVVPTQILSVVGSIWPQGHSIDLLVHGITVYTILIITVSLKAGLTLRSWNFITHFAIWGSIFSWYLWTIVYSYFWPALPMGPDFCRLNEKLFSSGVFWLLVILVPLLTLILDSIIKVSYCTFFTSSTEMGRQEDKKKASNKE